MTPPSAASARTGPPPSVESRPGGPATEGTVPGVATDTARPRRRRLRPPRPATLTRAVAALAAGVALYLAFPPVGAWPLAPVAVAAFTLLVRGRRLWSAYRVAFLFGLGFFLPLLRFVSFVGEDALVALAIGEAAILALAGPATVLALRLRASYAWAAVACVWVAQEAVRGRAPFGGFPWGRLAFSQPDGPYTPLAAVAGAPAMTFAVAATGALLALALHTLATTGRAALATRLGVPDVTAPPGPATSPTGPAAVPAQRSGDGDTRTGRHGRARVLALGAALPAAGIAALAAVGLAVPLPTAAQDGTLRVAAIQGDVPEPGGLDALGEKFQVTRNHVDETLRLTADVDAGRTPRPDLVVWPENSSDVDPFADPRAAALLDEAARAVGTPILLGAVLDGPGAGHVRNAGLVWTADGWAGQLYVKHRPVPFAEYLPGRALLQKVITRFATEMPNDFVHGTGPAVLPAAGTTIGDVICFEVAYDGNVRDSVDQGARLIVVQTNNASFGRKGESQQQLAMTRIRAVEHGRATIQVSTSGQSAIITPDGTILAQTGLYEPGILSAELPLRTGRTLADRVGAIPEAVASALAAAAIMAGIATGRRRPRPAGPTPSGAGHPGPDATPRDTPAPRAGHRPDGRGPERSGVDAHRVVVCMPTYNERENLTRTAHRLREANPAVDLLVIDDNSPDGTGQIADELAREDPQIHVLHRAGKSGLGSAYIAGFSWALRHGYDVIVEMDADGSHQPEELARLLARLNTADLVIGSRWVRDGQVRNWPRSRLILSRGANLYVRAALGIPLRDATAGYRAYRADVLRARDLDAIQSQGYCFQVDLAWTAWRAGFRVAEVPITFVERERGASKMSRSIIIEAFWRTALWALTSGRSGPAPRPLPTTPISVPAPSTEPALVTATATAGAPTQPTKPTIATTSPSASTATSPSSAGTTTVNPPAPAHQRTSDEP
ncbi:apolipoprotein N-acyltransferase [Pseudofrankia sp. BMG5.36]|uniref:apolipoprotein N-acyltransferase n=1 Tax=Pseudofrankia sp. BMG5.36 TaxID=1834512 RepID=UPI0008DA110C|nr:apolipoprotein N-acyltransferase [Pseudofrankia sp. BMG5.36]OHV45536.1 apolipoprotein N-acyltransferase [Pseudofrankia sp. BMG5.36]